MKLEHGVPEISCDPNNSPFFTICHGNLSLNHSLFLYQGEQPIDVKILGWNTMTYTCSTIDLESVITATPLTKHCITDIHKNFNDYFDALFRTSTSLEDESLSKFLLTFFCLLVFFQIPDSPENEREVVNFMNSLR